jgi:two-component sensor histidine kinase
MFKKRGRQMAKNGLSIIAGQGPPQSAAERYSALRAELAERSDRLRSLQTECEHLKRNCEALKRDLNHLLRQSQTAISAVTRLRAAREHSSEIRAFADRLQFRIHAMAAVHSQSDVSGSLDRVNLGPIVRQIGTEMASAFGPPRGIGMRIHAADLKVAVDKARCLALITAELVENAYDHAFAHRHFGAIELGVGAFNDRAGMLWVEDNGVGLVPEMLQQRHGLGWQTIEALSQSISADVIYELKQGTRIGILFPT